MQLIDAVQNEEARLNALRDLKLLNTPPSESFDRLTRLASQLLSAPVSTISLTDRDRQWFKSKVGVDLDEIPREQAPCSYAIQEGGIFVVPDLAADARFTDSPLVQAGIRFYAGAPLFTRAGHGLGTICVVDTVPRALGEQEGRVLQDLAGMVMSQIELQNMIGRVDATSGLPNQHQLFEDLEGRATRCPEGELSTVMVEFTSAAQTRRGTRVLGPSYADEFGAHVLARIQSQIGNSARLYHVGPMRCVVLLPEAALRTAEELVAVLAEALSVPVTCSGLPLTPEPAFGLSSCRAGTFAPRDVLRQLTAACDDARESQAVVRSYSRERDEKHARSFALANDFAAALRREGELALAYQPRVDTASGRLLSAEALLRWTHPSFGAVSPAEFIPLVEQTALAQPMTDWVTRTALRQVKAWRCKGFDCTVSINASALNLDERDFAERLLRAVGDADVPAERLELEFTESAVARDAGRVAAQLGELKHNGIEIAIDDFGTGYSNLAYLQQLPVSVLKIDRGFVTQLETSRRDRTLVKAMIRMAHDLGYRTVAEGVETQEVLDILAELGCDEVQGYFIARPMVPTAMPGWSVGRRPH